MNWEEEEKGAREEEDPSKDTERATGEGTRDDQQDTANAHGHKPNPRRLSSRIGPVWTALAHVAECKRQTAPVTPL